MLNLDIECEESCEWKLNVYIDTGSQIYIIKQNAVLFNLFVKPVDSKVSGINKSPLKVLGKPNRYKNYLWYIYLLV